MKKIRQPHINTTGPHPDSVMKAGLWIELDLDIAEVRSNAALPFAIELTKRLAEDPLKMEICRRHNPNPAASPSYGPALGASIRVRVAGKKPL